MIRLPGPGPEWLALEESTNIWSLYNPLINQDLSYDESLSGQPGAWLVKENKFYMHAITKLKKDLLLKFKMISRTSFLS